MANWYVDSSAIGTNAGTSWANACTSCSQLLALGSPPVAGDSIFIHNTSAESYATATTLNFPGSATSPIYIYSTDTTNTPPQSSDLLAGASISTTGNSNLTLQGGFYCYGVTFNVGNSSGTATLTISGGTSRDQSLENCTFHLASTGANSVTLGGNVAAVSWKNCTVKFGSVGDTINVSGPFFWKNSPLAVDASGSIPTTIFSNCSAGAVCEAVDFSALGSGKTVCLGNNTGQFFFKDCKLGASVTLASMTVPGARASFSRTDSSGTVNQFALYDYAGTETNNTTVSRSGGAVDFAGTAFSKKLVSTANAKVGARSFETLPMAVVNTLTGSTRTVTVYGYNAANALPAESDIWIEVEYPKDSGDPLGGYANSWTSGPQNPLTVTASTYTSDSSVWNGISSGQAFSMSISLTAGLQGPLTVRTYVGKASSTYYIDAMPVLS